MLAVDTLLYGLLAAWLDNIIPTEYGTRRQPWFFLVPSFWLSSSQVQRPLSSLPPLEESVDIEKAPVEQQGKEAVIIRNIQKTFKGIGKSTVKAVQGVSMDIYPGEITAILGHNGAGKSTLFNMLTGMTSASGGSATIFGYDINDSNQMNEIRKMTGICPQHDVLFDELTPREHLQFFARIRGIADQLINTEVDTILADIDLKEKANAIASKLSGGQKRKLSVGIALIGDPKLIFLDEPTAGVDPYSRRHLWSVLKQRKEGKVILLTTHFMDEADILADRKAIMTKGTIRCFGSSLFLKNRFGIGYHLTLVLKDESKVSTIRNAVQATIEGSEQARLFGKELSFVLPRDRVTSFPQLFHLVEKDIYGSGAMGISSYGVSMTTLEEVFLHIGEEEEIEDNDTTNIISSFREKTTRQLSLGAEDILDIPSTSNARPKDKNTSGYSFESIETHKSTWQMFKALLYLRTLIRFREPGMFFIQIVMPVAYICLGVYLSDLSNPKVDKDSEAALTPQMYRDDFNPYFYGYQSVSQSDSSFESDFENFTGKPLDKINYDVKFPELLGRNLVTVIKEEAGNAKYVGYFNDTAQHSIPILVNAMSNAYSMLYDIGNITVSSHPFKLTEIPQEFDGGAFSGNLFIGLTYAFIPCGFALELIYDRQIRAKNQLRVNGLTFPLYFGSIFVVLSILLLFLLCILLALIVAFNFKALLIPAAFGILTSMYILYILPGLLYIGCVSYLFDSMESGQFIFAFASWTGMIPYFAVMLTNSFQVLGGDLATGLHIAFAFISPVYIPFGIIYYIQNQYLFCSITRTCDSLTFSDYMVVEIYILYVALIFHTVFWGIGLKAVDIIKDGGNVRSMFQTKVAAKDNSDKIFNEDHDVQKERDTVESYMKNSTNTSSIPVIGVLGLRKEFTTGVDTKSSRMPCKKTKGDVTMKVAVRNMSLKVEPGEVFGLLGHNGAGKTTAMRMITQEEAVTAGRVRIGEEDITSNQSPAFHQLGYCPQFDALWQRVTVREHLEVYAAIRGVPPHKITALIDGYMAGLRISEHAKKYAKDCSGGTKRKLSYAMAMLGDPRIVLLDEPSTGMDPQSKRFVWDTIEASFKMDRGAILTTHSMEEADALCTRVGIMVKGELRCLGSTQHLKNKFGAGYMLEIKWKTRVVSDWDQLEEEIFKIFPGAESLESFSDRRSWTISQSAVTSLASAFQQLEKCKAQFDIEDYSFSQTTLEQVFIEFAKQQEAEDNDSKAAVTVRSRLEQLPEGNNLTSF